MEPLASDFALFARRRLALGVVRWITASWVACSAALPIRIVHQIVVNWARVAVGFRKMVLAIHKLRPVFDAAVLVLAVEEVVFAIAIHTLIIVIFVAASRVTNRAALLGILRPASTSSAAVVDSVVLLFAWAVWLGPVH